jgi:hypothetical protein
MKWFGCLLVFFILSTTPFVIAQSVVLKDIKTVNVTVAPLSDDLINDGVTLDAVRNALDIGLRTVGLTVLSQGQYQDTVPTITLRVLAIKEPNGRFYATDIILACLDNVTNLRTKRMFTATIWSNDLLQLLGIVDLNRVLEGENKLLDMFIDDYLKANRK